MINDYIKINDFLSQGYSKDEYGEVWSVTHTSNAIQDKRNIELFDYIITNRLHNVIDAGKLQKRINSKLDRKVAIGIELAQLRGLHSVTAVWYRPDGSIHHIGEEALLVEEGDINNVALTWFWMDLDKKDLMLPRGIWGIKLFIDGKIVVNDNFELIENLKQYIDK